MCLMSPVLVIFLLVETDEHWRFKVTKYAFIIYFVYLLCQRVGLRGICGGFWRLLQINTESFLFVIRMTDMAEPLN